MKTIQELKDMQEEKMKLYDELKKQKDLDMADELYQKEKLIIAGTWVDFIDDLLDYNLVDFMNRKGYNDDDIETTFTVKDKEVQKEIFITEKQALEMLEHKKKICNEHPYGLVIHKLMCEGIYIEKIEIDILKWFLEIE